MRKRIRRGIPGRGRSARPSSRRCRRGTGSAIARAVRPLDLEQVAGAEILDRDDRADRAPVAIDAGQADQVGVIIFALFERRQAIAVDLDQLPAQRLGGGAVGDALEAGDGGLAAVLDDARASALAPPTKSCAWRVEAVDAVREQLEPHLALHAMRAGDRGERDALVPVAGDAHGLLGLLGVLGGSAFGRSPRRRFLGRTAPRRRARRRLLRQLGSLFGRSAPRQRLPRPAASSAAGASSAAASSAGASSAAASSAAASSAGALFGSGFLGGSLFGRGFFGGGFLSRQLPRPRLPRHDFLDRRRGRGGSLAASSASAALGRTLLDALLGLLARLALLRVVAGGALLDAGGIEEAQRRGPTAGRRPTANARCGRRRASRAPGESFASSGL